MYFTLRGGVLWGYTGDWTLFIFFNGSNVAKKDLSSIFHHIFANILSHEKGTLINHNSGCICDRHGKVSFSLRVRCVFLCPWSRR